MKILNCVFIIKQILFYLRENSSSESVNISSKSPSEASDKSDNPRKFDWGCGTRDKKILKNYS